jgi:hypothetical protein
MTLFDPNTGQFVTIDLSPSAQETEASLGERASRGRTAQPDRHEDAPAKRVAGVVPSTSEQTSSPSSDGAAVLAVLGALGALYLPLLWV